MVNLNPLKIRSLVLSVNISNTLLGWLLISFLCTQAFAVSHAAEHAFHENDIVCDSLLSVEHSPLATSTSDTLLITSHYSDATSLTYQFTLCSRVADIPIRGPPSYS